MAPGAAGAAQTHARADVPVPRGHSSLQSPPRECGQGHRPAFNLQTTVQVMGHRSLPAVLYAKAEGI